MTGSVAARKVAAAIRGRGVIGRCESMSFVGRLRAPGDTDVVHCDDGAQSVHEAPSRPSMILPGGGGYCVTPWGGCEE
jgi:hypothetical protein